MRPVQRRWLSWSRTLSPEGLNACSGPPGGTDSAPYFSGRVVIAWVSGGRHFFGCNKRMIKDPTTTNAPPSAKDGDGKSIDPGTCVFPIMKELEPGLVNIVGTGEKAKRRSPAGLFFLAFQPLTPAPPRLREARTEALAFVEPDTLPRRTQRVFWATGRHR